MNFCILQAQQLLELDDLESEQLVSLAEFLESLVAFRLPESTSASVKGRQRMIRSDYSKDVLVGVIPSGYLLRPRVFRRSTCMDHSPALVTKTATLCA